MITLTQLEYVVAVGRTGNFRQAAKACFVTQPTLSMQVQKLEQELGVVLFDRSSHPVQPTAIGRRILEQAAVVLSQASRITALVDEAKESLEGELRLGVIPTVAPYLVPLFLERFFAACPNVRVHIDEVRTDEIVAQLRTGDLDVGLLATPLEESLIEEHALFREPFYVYAERGSELSEREAVSEDELAAHRVLLLTEGHCLRTQVAQVCGFRDKARGDEAGGFDFDSGSLETLCRLVDRGLGYTVIPHLSRGSSTSRRGVVVPFTSPRPSREIGLVVHASFARHALLDALAEAIKASVPPELLKGDQGALRTLPVR